VQEMGELATTTIFDGIQPRGLKTGFCQTIFMESLLLYSLMV